MAAAVRENPAAVGRVAGVEEKLRQWFCLGMRHLQEPFSLQAEWGLCIPSDIAWPLRSRWLLTVVFQDCCQHHFEEELSKDIGDNGRSVSWKGNTYTVLKVSMKQVTCQRCSVLMWLKTEPKYQNAVRQGEFSEISASWPPPCECFENS